MKTRSLVRAPKIKVPLFESGDVVFCDSIESWNAVHDRLGVDAGEGLTNGASHTLRSGSGTVHIIGVFNGSVSTLAHECSHVAFDICGIVGVTVTPGEANETFCYLISRLVDFGGKWMQKPAINAG